MTAQIDPTDIRRATLRDGDVSVTILSLGCITQGWWVPLAGSRVPVVLGFADPADYLRHPQAYLGAIVGRVANRTADARFDLNGETHYLTANEGRHHLHGGPGGLSRCNWQMDSDGTRAVRLTHTSPDKDQGYPGTVRFETTITLTGHRLHYVMTATPDRPSPINLAQHNYYNLMGLGGIHDHELQIRADQFTPNGAGQLPDGRRMPVTGTRYDFRARRRLGDADPDRRGHDANLILRPGAPACELRAPNGLQLRLWTDQPGLQLYSGQALNVTARAHPGQSLSPFSGVCLEPQKFPNSLNEPGFGSIIHTPETPYRQTLEVEIR